KGTIDEVAIYPRAKSASEIAADALLSTSNQASAISLNTTAFESAPMLQFVNSNSSLNLNYSYTNLSKSELIVNGSTLLTNYSISITLNSSCLNSNCSNATWAGGPPNVDSTTKGLWHFDEGSGNSAYDSSGNGNTGSFSGLNFVPTWVGGKYGYGLNFDWTDAQHIAVTDSNSLHLNGSITMELWFRETSTGSGLGEWLLNKDSSTNYNNSNYALWTDNLNKIRGAVSDCSVVANLTSATIISLNTWYHVAFTYDGSTIKLYVNGVLENSSSQTITPLPNTQPLLIGARKAGTNQYNFNGTIDEVAIYSRAKSASEIAADANLFHWDWSPIAMNNNLSAAWHFDEGSGNITYDSSGNGNTGGFTGTQTAVLLPSGTNKAYAINSTSTDNPFIATTEVNYSNVNASDSIYETESASYTNTWGGSCQTSGSCSCRGGSSQCFDSAICQDITGCSASCPSAVNASVTSTCTPVGSDCSQLCSGGCIA
ncbi:LamG domain-containing protein, partial [Candidatus Micrarchaeota archaeon]|nr:LamG domain-containing protein [Candidatus Micrarchaeota archaeon]